MEFQSGIKHLVVCKTFQIYGQGRFWATLLNISDITLRNKNIEFVLIMDL